MVANRLWGDLWASYMGQQHICAWRGHCYASGHSPFHILDNVTSRALLSSRCDLLVVWGSKLVAHFAISIISFIMTRVLFGENGVISDRSFSGCVPMSN